MQPGTGGFADGVEARQLGPCGNVGDHTAAGEVCGRHYGNPLLRDIDAQLKTALVDIGKVFAQEAGRAMGDVEIDAIDAVLFHFEVDGAGDDIARGQLGARVVVGHESGTVRQAQQGTFASDRLGDQEGLRLRVVEAGGVELDELHVRHAATGTPGHGHAIAGGGVGIGGVEVGLAGTTSGQHRMRGTERDDMVMLDVEDIGAPAALARQPEFMARDQVDSDVMFEHRDVAVVSNLLGQGLLYGSASGIGGVDDATMAVAAFARQVKPQFGFIPREGDALIDQPAHGGIAVFDDIARGGFVTQAGTGDQGVVDMGFDRVGGVEHGGNAALCPRGGRVFELAFGDQRYIVGRGKAQGKGLSRQAATEDEHVEVFACSFAGHDHADYIIHTELIDSPAVSRVERGERTMAAGASDILRALPDGRIIGPQLSTIVTEVTTGNPLRMGEREADQVLVKRIQAGDQQAFGLLVTKYQRKLMRLVMRLVRDPAEAEDVTQEAFIKAYRALPNFRGESAFYTWLYRIGINAAKNWLMSNGRRAPTSTAIDSEEAEGYDGSELLQDTDTPERLMMSRQIGEQVNAAMDRLPEDLRTAISMREIDGLSYEEIAEAMNCPIGTVRSRIFRAREAIAQELKPLLDTAPDRRW